MISLCRMLVGIEFTRSGSMRCLMVWRMERSFTSCIRFTVEPRDESVVAGETEYGSRYASVVAKRNICGVQFHPEKSQDVGLRLLRNFARFKLVQLVSLCVSVVI